MDVSGVIAVLNGILTAILLIGGSAIGLTLGAAGLCTMFAWLDMHIGGFIKKVFASVLLGGSMMAGGGAFGLWVTNTLGVARGG
jgi:hypothetical protein